MLYVCAEVYLRGQHGYRLVRIKDGLIEFKDVPDKYIKSFIESKELRPWLKGAPVIVDGVVKSGKDLYTFINKVGTNQILVMDYNAKLKTVGLKDVNLWNAHYVEYMTPNNELVGTVIDNDTDYRDMVDALYHKFMSEDEIKEKAERLSIKASIINADYKIDEFGNLDDFDIKDRTKNEIVIPNGVVTARVSARSNVIASRTLKKLVLGYGVDKVDLSKCEDLHEISAEYSFAGDITFVPTIRNISGNFAITNADDEIVDWELLKYTNGMFRYIKTSTLKLINSRMQDNLISVCRYNNHIKNLYIGKNIQRIEEKACAECQSLIYINFGDSCSIIGKGAFEILDYDYNYKVKELTLDGIGGIVEIGAGAFNRDCKIKVDWEKFKKLRKIGSGAFGSIGQQEVYLNDSVEIVEKEAFIGLNIRLSRNLTDRSFANVLKSCILKGRTTIYYPSDLSTERLKQLNYYSRLGYIKIKEED